MTTTSENAPRRRAIRRGELLAIREQAVHHDGPAAFFWLFGPPVYENERVGSVEVVRVNGPLEHHDDGMGDSYECIVKRVKDAFDGKHRDGSEVGIPSAVVMRLDTPGGVVAGLHETVVSLRAMAAQYKIPLIGYVDETAYSAGYALSCACSELYLPRSGFCGSIGVISTLVDQTEKDKKDGYRFVVLTSGARKADGHPHVPITDAVVDEEAPRVEQLAMQFYKDVRKARGLSIDTIRGFEAKRFLGAEAVKAGVADGIMGWDELIGTLNAKAQVDTPLAQPGSRVSQSTRNLKGEAMPIGIDAMILRTKEAMKAEKDPEKLAALAGDLSAYKKTKTHIEKHETEEGEDDAGEDDDEATSEKGDETERKTDDPDDEGDDPDKDDDSDDEDDDEDDEDEEESSSEESEEEAAKSAASSIVRASGLTTKSARRALLKVATGMLLKTMRASAAYKVYKAASKMTGKRGASSVISVLQGHSEASKELRTRVASIENERRNERKTAMIDKALAARRITKPEAKLLRGKKEGFVSSYLELRPTALVHGSETDLARQADGSIRGGGSPSPISAQDPAVQKEIRKALAAAARNGIKLEEKDIVAALNASHKSFPEN